MENGAVMLISTLIEDISVNREGVTLSYADTPSKAGILQEGFVRIHLRKIFRKVPVTIPKPVEEIGPIRIFSTGTSFPMLSCTSQNLMKMRFRN